MRAAVLGVALLGWVGLALAQPAKPPAEGVLISAEAGDIACSLGIRGDTGQTQHWMAEFELCEGAASRHGRRFALTWREAQVQHPNCQGNPECRQTRRVLLIVALKPLPG